MEKIFNGGGVWGVSRDGGGRGGSICVLYADIYSGGSVPPAPTIGGILLFAKEVDEIEE